MCINIISVKLNSHDLTRCIERGDNGALDHGILCEDVTNERLTDVGTVYVCISRVQTINLRRTCSESVDRGLLHVGYIHIQLVGFERFNLSFVGDQMLKYRRVGCDLVRLQNVHNTLHFAPHAGHDKPGRRRVCAVPDQICSSA